MKFQCKACGESFSAMEWNNYTRRNKSENSEFIPIQTIYDNPDHPKAKKIKFFCPNCSINKPDVNVKIDKT
ncbi:hypothetical protein SAMN04488598_1612 [Halanaerobium congolense]|jgi:DNA-directed RNA polymerase subunit M/transcription elongation factor TFIIS|uniref:Uncharacterized protein n=1 Tax=Halanaerobium congolense TaxID=54121 RepID=A0A1I0CHW4_9FIRM|nr:hypothetical protein [Halanaerobium congolense]PTX14828.1 hypothetical protein C7953_2894 [Halanaerobium congolense]SDG20429.1 hypothetical protein SAMN04488598_1612 [Halanaerobium congolense]SET19183.1 hypothetical protein SAMN04515652_13716 [Halanaerobium congolense]SFP78903.1 hypothetical protein SAMN04488596_1622 [Halanaerobium congolense]